MNTPNRTRAASRRHRPIRTSHVTGAHADDIHGVLQLGPGHIVSGSKDGCVKLWSLPEDSEPNGAWPADIVGAQAVLHKPQRPTRHGTPWITALCAVGRAGSGDGSPWWASATRHGSITLWDGPADAPRRARTINLAQHSRRTRDHVCKVRNHSRVMCAASAAGSLSDHPAAVDSGGDPGAPASVSSVLLVGLAAQVAIVPLAATPDDDDDESDSDRRARHGGPTTGRDVCFRRASANDWIYTMRFVGGTSRVLAAIGPAVCTFDAAHLIDDHHHHDDDDNDNDAEISPKGGVHPSVETVLSEDAHREAALAGASRFRFDAPRSRLFVSALDQGGTSPDVCLMACFDGTVKTLDVERGIVRATADHYYRRGVRSGAKGRPATTRVWSCSVLDADGCVFASSADDGRVLIWDSRSAGPGPVRSLPPRVGRVSVAMPLRRGGPGTVPCAHSDPLLISYCADDPRRGGGSHMETWDLRMLRPASPLE